MRALSSPRQLLDRLQQQIPQRQPDPPEESILLRILAQSLVLIGILATDIAAETHMWVWAIPASIIGSLWSWHRRHTRNIATKFLLAIGMLIALVAFFYNMLVGRELNDTRLVLAELLVQIQVLHSFDIPRRKDLGYSMVIGLILLGVASTLSQTMAFGGMLLLFLAIGLPVLVMDYRSRLGFRHWFQPSPTAPKRRWNLGNLPWIFALTLTIGLALFAVMPRLPGYQFRSFPMSAPVEVQPNFDNRRVLNPGYVRDGQQNGRNGRRGTAPSEGAGQMDEEFYYGFGERINQNLRGQLKPKVVMRVRSQAPGFWRVQSFDRYTGQGWQISRNDDAKTIQRSPWAYQFYLDRLVTLNKTKEVVQTYTITADLPNVIPAMAQPKELFFPTQQVVRMPDGSLRSPVSLIDGMTYTVISEVPYRNRKVLQSAASKIPLAPGNTNDNLQIPPEIAAKVRQETERLLATAPSPITSDYEKALYLAQALKQRYSVQQDLPSFAKDEDLVEAFLFKYKGGYRDHFSTVLTMMLRSIGLSARLTTGFLPGEFNPFTGLYIVRNTDAFALTEVYFHKYGWFAFDPIPQHPLIPPAVEEDQTFTVLQQFWNWVAGWIPSPVSGFFNRLFGPVLAWLSGVLANFIRLFTQGFFGWMIAAIILTSLSFLGWLGWQGWRKWRYAQRLKRLPPMEQLYQQLLDWLTEQGWPKHPTQTPLEYVQQSIQPAQQTQRLPQSPLIPQILQAYVAWRYGGKAIAVEPLAQQFHHLQRQQWRQQWQKQGRSILRNGFLKSEKSRKNRRDPK